MAGVLHGSARTTPRIRAELQASQEKTSTLAQRYGLSRTTVNKGRSRTTTADAPMGPTAPHSTVLTLTEEAMVVEFRRRTLLPLDDVLGWLRETIPKLTRSSLHRCLERHGISRLPESLDKGSKRGRFAETTIGYVHICPARGVGAAIIMPATNTEAMNIHLADISTQVAAGAHAVLMIDGAGCTGRVAV